MKTFQRIIKEICEEDDIKVSFLSKDWITVLEKDGKTKYIAGYKFDLNNHCLGLVLDDKYAMYDVLKTKKLPIINHHILYRDTNNNDYAIGCNSYLDALDLFNKYNCNVVLKPNNGTCGVGVCHITDEIKLKEMYDKLLTNNFSISLCPFYEIENEYRTIILNNNVKLMYGKIRPIVLGDGKSTIKELLEQFNYEYFKGYDEINKDIVLEAGQQFEYDWKFNLSRGSKMFLDINQSDYNNISSLALQTSLMVGLGFGSVDIIKTKDGKYYIMEINSGVMMDNFIKQSENGYNIAKSIYKEAVMNMFKE